MSILGSVARRAKQKRDTRFVEIGRWHSRGSASGDSTGGWRTRKSFDAGLQGQGSLNREGSRRTTDLISIHEHLPPQARKDLKEVGWTKGIELAKVARRDGQRLRLCNPVCTKREMPAEDFRREVEKELTAKRKQNHRADSGYFVVSYESQIPVIEQAIETAALIHGHRTNRSAILSGDDLCRFSVAGAQSGQWQPRSPAPVDLALLQILARRTAAGFPSTTFVEKAS